MDPEIVKGSRGKRSYAVAYVIILGLVIGLAYVIFLYQQLAIDIKGYQALKGRVDSSQKSISSVESSLRDLPSVRIDDGVLSVYDGSVTQNAEVLSEDEVLAIIQNATITGTPGATGAQGVAGRDGAVGATGATGATGAAGADGSASAKGDKGDTGATGAQGLQGATGATGAAGINGTNGTNGAQGLKGNTGDTGVQGVAGATGATGATGAKGDKGDTGDAGVLSTSFGNGLSGSLASQVLSLNIVTAAGGGLSNGLDGLSLLANCDTDEILKWNGTSWVCASDENGAATVADLTSSTAGVSITGGTGAVIGNGATVSIATATGSQNGLISSVDWQTFSNKESALTFNGNGIFERNVNTISAKDCQLNQTFIYNGSAWGCGNAAKGDTGNTGAQGIQGETGAQGPKGNAGDVGATGAQGIQGVQGVKGDTGATGSQGIQGQTGATGATGAAGTNGTNGTNGAQGLKGDKGDTGDVGATGAQGAQGVKGDTGATGAQGVKGDTGDTGVLSTSLGNGLNGSVSGQVLSLSLVTAAGSGLSNSASGLSLLNTCSNNQILKWSGSAWVCSTDASYLSGTGTPEATVTASIGTLYTDLATGIVYSKITGTGNTGWVSLAQSNNVSLSSLVAANASSTIDNLANGLTWNWSTNTTGTGLAINQNGLTTGNAFSIASTGTTTTGSLLYTTSASTGLFANGGVRFAFTGAHTGTGLLLSDATTTGQAMNVAVNSLTTGGGLLVSGTGTTTTGMLFRVQSSSTGNFSTTGAANFTFAAHTGSGIQVTDSTATGTSVNVTTNSLTAGTGLNVTSTGTTTTGKILNTSSASAGAYTAGGVSFNFTGAHTGSGVLVTDATLAGTALGVTANTLTSGNGFAVNSTATALTGNLGYIALTGNAVTNTGNLLSLSSTGASSPVTGLKINVAGTGLALDVTGSVAFRAGTTYTASGIQNDVTSFLNSSYYRLAPTADLTLTGITGGVDGKLLTLTNTSAFNVIVANQNVSSVTAANRIITGKSADVTLAADQTITFQYDSVAARWRMVSTTGI